jgi:Phage integrase family
MNASAILDVPELLTTAEVAALLKVNRSTLSRSRSAGAGPRVTWRTLAWASIAQGRRIHDLRHTAACLWLARGVDPVTVQAWMRHAPIATTNLYLHHLGTTADRAGLDRLNHRGHTGAHAAWSSPNNTLQIRERFSVSHLVRALLLDGGAKGDWLHDIVGTCLGT